MPDGIPVEQVKSMRQQGITDDQIVETLQRDGYKSTQIFDAMTQADMKPATEVKQVTDDFPDIAGSIANKPAPHAQPMPVVETDFEPMPDFNPNVGGENIQEIVESIVDEMWSELEKDVQKIVDWKNSTEKKINSMQEEMKLMKDQFDKLQTAVLGKVGDYDKNIMNVGAEIKALEKAFSNIMPEFTDSVSQLTGIVDNMKKSKKSPVTQAAVTRKKAKKKGTKRR